MQGPIPVERSSTNPLAKRTGAGPSRKNQTGKGTTSVVPIKPNSSIGALAPEAATHARNSMAFRPESAVFGARLFQPRGNGRQKIEKRTFWRSLPRRYPSETASLSRESRTTQPCHSNRLRPVIPSEARNLLFPNPVPWPGQFLEVLRPQNIRCRTRTRVANCAQPATQLLSIHCLYQNPQKYASPNHFFRTKVYCDGSREELMSQLS